MKLKNLQWVACAFAASAILAGCSKDATSDLNTGDRGSKSGCVRIKTTLTLDDVASTDDFRSLEEELRLSIVNKTDGDRLNGVRFLFAEGETVKLYTYFKQNGQIVVAEPVDITLKEPKRSSDSGESYYLGVTELKVPAGIDLSTSAAEVTVAGAIGVESIDNTGKATIKPVEVEADGDKAYSASVPMYFPEMKLNKADTTLVFTQNDGTKTPVPHLRFYGALLRLKVASNAFDPIRVSQVVLQTGAFTTSGQMDLTTASQTVEPEWTTDQVATTFQEVNFGDIVVPGSSEGVSGSTSLQESEQGGFVWVKPGSYASTEATREMTIYVRENDYTLDPGVRSEAFTGKYRVKPLGKKVYSIPTIRLETSLIYTEYVIGAQDTEVEIYNAGHETVNLGDFYHNRQTYGIVNLKGYTPIDIIGTNLLSDRLGLAYDKDNRSGKASELKDWGNTNIGATAWSSRVKPTGMNLYLKPGETALFLPGGVPIKDKMKQSATYIFKFRSAFGGVNDRTAFANNGLAVAYTLTKGGVFVDGSLDNWINSNEEGDLAKIVDVYMYYKDREGRRNITQGRCNRRPDRSFPRKYWAKGEFGSDSDWVGATGFQMEDLGFRFGRYYDPENPVVYGVSLSGVGGMHKFTNIGTYSEGVLKLRYTPPTFWTKEVVH